ncbi:hypothetical protein RFI_10059, partial [Reticulomyxa filosa]
KKPKTGKYKKSKMGKNAEETNAKELWATKSKDEMLMCEEKNGDAMVWDKSGNQGFSISVDVNVNADGNTTGNSNNNNNNNNNNSNKIIIIMITMTRSMESTLKCTIVGLWRKLAYLTHT